jgi:tungstate transport system substrate-binding protein
LLPVELEPYTKPVLSIATGSPYELGLIDALSKPFDERYDCKVEVTKAGSGASLDLGREGAVDLVMVHAPEAEAAFLADGYGLDRTYVMHNEFVIVGPEGDPAGIRGMTNATEAYKKVAESKSLFFSRGDHSGTHEKELSIWERAGIAPEGDWYKETNAFMADTLKTANAAQGYFMTDRSTYITLKRDMNLTILVEGDPVLVNQYHAIAVNPAKHPTVNYEQAKSFIAFLSSSEGQAIIEDYGKEEFGESLYFVAAAAAATPASSPMTVPSVTIAPSPTPSPTPGFEAVFVVTALFVITYILQRKRKE